MEIIVKEEENENMLPAAKRAVQITERIRANGRTAMNAVCAIGKDLRTMKIDKLYTELGYTEFEEYAESEFQLKRSQTYQYISVFEKLGEEFVHANAQLGITKLSLLAAANPEDREEVMESSNVAKMTTKELEELLASYKEQGEQLSFLQEENNKLEAKVEELESAPKDVEIATKEVIKEVIKEVPDKKAEKKLHDTEKELKQSEKNLRDTKEKFRELEEKLSSELKYMSSEKERLEQELADLKKTAVKPAENLDKSSFKSMLTSCYKEITGLVEFVKNSEPEDRKTFMKKALEILNVGKDALKAIDPCIEVESNNE